MSQLIAAVSTDPAPVVVAATKVWWHLSRASGVVAWGLATAAVLWGLALSTRALGPKPRAPWLLDVHRFLGAGSVVFVTVHVVALLFDPFVSFGPVDVLVPLASGWQPVAVAWGVVAFWLLVAVEGTSLLKARIPARLWKGVHLASYVVYATATIHLFVAGTDATNPLLEVAAWSSVAAIAFFTLYRIIGPGRVASIRSARSAGAGVDRSRAASRGAGARPGTSVVPPT